MFTKIWVSLLVSELEAYIKADMDLGMSVFHHHVQRAPEVYCNACIADTLITQITPWHNI